MDDKAQLGLVQVTAERVSAHLLSKAIVKIGHDPKSHVIIQDDDVARMHSVIEIAQDEVTIIDLGGEPGTVVNGARVNKVHLRPQDQIRFTKTILEVAVIGVPEDDVSPALIERTLHWLGPESSALSLAGLRLTQLTLPSSKLEQVRELYLGDNRLTEVPDFVAELTELQVLDLSGNDLRSIPSWLLGAKKLRVLRLHGNPRLALPPEILGRPGQEILTHLARLASEKAVALKEAKVIVVGQGAVGKTSLVRRLMGRGFDIDERKTDGIRIEQWRIPARAQDGTDDGRLVSVNVWDFGGQEIMHATHQFFLTKRCVYLLILDARKGENESNVRYWLQIIQSYGGQAPVLVVVNKIDTGHLELNEVRLRKDNPVNIRGVFCTSCSTGQGLDELARAISDQVHALPHVYDRLPASFLRIKGKLEARATQRDFLDLEEYSQLCRSEGVAGASEQQSLLRFLHDLGTVLNFNDENDPYQLRETNILNPEWATRGVYDILNDNSLMQAHGVVRLADLDRVLGGTRYPPERRQFVIELMRKFELCFSFPGEQGRYLVPELLGKNEIELGLDEMPGLRFEYHYAVLPRGLLPRFIVRMHHRLTQHPTYWLYGVLLRIDGSRVLVRADVDAGRMFVLVLDELAQRRTALAVVRDAFQAIHVTVPGLVVAEKVPLPDAPSVVVDYQHLVNLEGIEANIWPEGASRRYAVKELLDGVDASGQRRAATNIDFVPEDLSRRAEPTSPVDVRRLILVVSGFCLALLMISAAIYHFLGDGVAFGAVLSGSIVAVISVMSFVAFIIGRLNQEGLLEIVRLLLRRRSPEQEVKQ